MHHFHFRTVSQMFPDPTQAGAFSSSTGNDAGTPSIHFRASEQNCRKKTNIPRQSWRIQTVEKRRASTRGPGAARIPIVAGSVYGAMGADVSLEASLSCRFCGRNPQDFRKIRKGCRDGGACFPVRQLVKKDCAGHPDESDAAACTSRLVFPERKRRKNSSSGQDCARKIVRFSAIRSLFPPP